MNRKYWITVHQSWAIFAGCGNQAGEDNRDVARMSVLLAGFPKEVPGITVNKNCSSALSAINLAARSILAKEGSLYIGSGVESMSRAPWSMPKPSKIPSTSPPKIFDTTVGWRYENPKLDAMYPIISLGEGAELIAQEMQISREEQDKFAIKSQNKAAEAMKQNKFNDEILYEDRLQRLLSNKIIMKDNNFFNIKQKRLYYFISFLNLMKFLYKFVNKY